MRWLSRAGGLVLLVSLFLPWYGDNVAVITTSGGTGLHILVSGTGTAWQTFAVFDVLLAVLAVAIVVAPRGRSLLGLVALVLVAHLLLDRPEAGFAPPVYGAWIGLGGAALAAVPRELDVRAHATGLGGLALLVSLSTRWYSAAWADMIVSSSATERDRFLILPQSAWDALLVIDLVLAAVALVVLAVPLTRSPRVQTIARAVGWVAIVLVAARIVFEPDDTKLAYGAFVALAAAVLAWASTWLPRYAGPS